MSNILDFLKSLNLDVSLNTTSYVYYTPADGKIYKISSVFESDPEYKVLEVDHSAVEDILTGSKNTDDFYVAYDVSLKQLVLKERTYEEDLEIINTKLFRLPVFKRTTDNIGNKRSMVFEHIYDGVEALIWVTNTEYHANSIIWYSGNLYKVNESMPASLTFDFSKVSLYLEDVALTNVKSSGHFLEYKTQFDPIYAGVHVDVWYNELSHLAGQHVWIDNAVYRLKHDQAANTYFDINNVDLIEKDVLLFNDENKSLNFTRNLYPGSKILDNNKLYIYSDQKLSTEVLSKEKVIMFYTSKYHALTYNESTRELVRLSLIEKNNQTMADIAIIGDTLELLDIDDVKTGQKILIGKTLYLVNLDDTYEYDINVVQNNFLKCWEIYLGKKARRSLEEINYSGSDMMYFSVTAKHDPNILLRTVEFSLKNLLADKVDQRYPYQYEWEFNKEDVSIYTSKYFESYAHEVVE